MGWTTRGFPDNDDQQRWNGAAADAGNDQLSLSDLNDFNDFDDTDDPLAGAAAPAEPDPGATVQAIVAQDFSTRRLPAISDTRKAPVIVRGSGVAMGAPIIKRRERPLTLRVAVLTLMACILVTGIFAFSPLGNDQANAGSTFQALASSMVWNRDPRYFLYTAQTNDTADTIARKFKVQVGGIFKLNNLYAGEEVSIGVAYKIPEDPNYGKGYAPPTIPSLAPAHFGSARFGPNWWNSNAGAGIPAESPCAPNGGQNPLGYKLTSPNWNSYWVRGYIVYGTWVYHTGVDLAAPRGNPIHAAQAGQVIWAGWDVGGLGFSVKINHCNHVSTVYGHMDVLLVKAGDTVLQGDEIGLEGSTGWSTGPHLHFMVEWDNQPVDPMSYYGYNNYAITHNV